MLSEIVRLLQEHGSLPVQEIALSLKVDSGALHPMLEMLERKGKIEKMELPCKTACAGGCTKADTMIYYKVKPEP